MKYDKQGHVIIDNLDEVDIHIREREAALKKNKLFCFENGTIKVDHIATAHAMVAFINSIPKLDPWIKKVMIMRIGRPVLNGRPMSHMQIALELGMTTDEVLDLERAGVAIANEWMQKVTITDGINSSMSTDSLVNETMEKVDKVQD